MILKEVVLNKSDVMSDFIYNSSQTANATLDNLENESLWFTNFSNVLPNSRVGYYASILGR